jgi:L-2,4-diaminobutyrate transaminase
LRQEVGDHPLVGEVRGEHLLAAVELVADQKTKQEFDESLLVGPRLSKYSIEAGLIVRSLPLSTAISFSPPLVISESECDEALAHFTGALNRLTDELVKEGTWKPA